MRRKNKKIYNMNSDSVNEYILWLKRFREIYKEYIDDPSKQLLTDIFAETLGKFHKILSENNTNSTEENIIRSLKQLVKNFSVIYDANESKNKSKIGPRSTDAFKQNIYETEIAKLKELLIANINDPKFGNNFESIVMFVAKKRQMIEFLKLGKENDAELIDDCVYFEFYGKRRLNDTFRSPLITSHAIHLHNSEEEKKRTRTIKYKHSDIKIDLTTYVPTGPSWMHTNGADSPQLFEIMNELYSEFLILDNRRNNASKRDILPELYWLYMQTCPFERGSASIGEILFSVLLRKHFKGCDFFISNGWNGNPEIIPDIHALHYELDHFKSIFWDQFTNCTGKPNPNINNATANRLRAEVIGL
jgi:hypothetical protein